MTARPDYLDRLKVGKKKSSKPEVPVCEWEGCEKPGPHKAPAGRDMEGRFRHYCIDHVREYNKNYNYFSGLKDEAIAKFQREHQTTGGRPTWKMGDGSVRAASTFSTMRSGSSASLNRAKAGYASGTARPGPRRRKLKTLEAKALETLELGEEASSDDIKRAYKVLVKRHHPDANGGDRASEERFRDVIKAYQILKAAKLTS